MARAAPAAVAGRKIRCGQRAMIAPARIEPSDRGATEVISAGCASRIVDPVAAEAAVGEALGGEAGEGQLLVFAAGDEDAASGVEARSAGT